MQKARKDLQEASIDYGNAIDGKPTEKYFLEPQNRIDTALAHYKIIGDQKAPVETAAAVTTTPVRAASTSSAATKAAPSATAPSDAMTDDQVIAMVSAGIDDANVIDTIQHAKAVNFDLSVQGQVNLAKNKVSSRVLSAMKVRSRAPATHHVAASSSKSSS